TAILFQKGIRKALRANALKNGRFVFPNVPAADYTVYVIPDRKVNKDYLPTFYINKLVYKNADYYTLKDGMNEIAINLRRFVKRPGTGRIYGNVNFETSNLKDSVLNCYGDQKYLYSTDNSMAINLPVILFDGQGTPIDWTISDESGNYAFDNIALDSYKIVTETAESQAESTVVLSQGNAVVGANMVLKVQNVIDELPILQGESFSLYPNPVSDKLYLQSTTGNTARIYNSLGQLILDRYLPAGTNELDVQHFNKGVYIVKMGSNTQKMIRK
ncbi:MAG: T9SS type A sorting domain-containing protein, partial [Bacteroidia bacterium]|nr:T9SS type A sorting domain-containing protein [Bacteroidia bacterium]